MILKAHGKGVEYGLAGAMFVQNARVRYSSQSTTDRRGKSILGRTLYFQVSFNNAHAVELPRILRGFCWSCGRVCVKDGFLFTHQLE